mgnify:FL=1
MGKSMNIIDLFSQNKLIQSWHAGVSNLGRQLIMGLSGASRALAIASAYQANEEKIVIITSTQNEVEKLASDLSSLIGEDKVYTFFADDVAAAEFIFASMDKAHSRLEALNFLQDKNQSGILITSLVGARVLLPSPKTYSESQLNFLVGDLYNLDKIVKILSNVGYQKVSQVLNPGEFSDVVILSISMRLQQIIRTAWSSLVMKLMVFVNLMHRLKNLLAMLNK